MSRYTIGDRVEVLWQGELFAATVIYIHEAEGACDAAYEIDDSVGVFLTAEEHGLKLLPDRPEEAEPPPLSRFGRDSGGETSTGRSASPSSLSETSDSSASSSVEVVPRTPWQPPPIGFSNGNGFKAGKEAEKEAEKEVEKGDLRSRTMPKQNTYAYDSGIKQEAAVPQQTTIEAASASVAVSTAGATAAANGLYNLVYEMERNKEATTKEIQQGFHLISQASIKQRDVLIKDVDDRYKGQRAAVEAQIAELEGIATRSEAGRKKMCLMDDCTNKVNARGLCDHHGRKPCSVEGCATTAAAHGLCNKHGARGKCVKASCTTLELSQSRTGPFVQTFATSRFGRDSGGETSAGSISPPSLSETSVATNGSSASNSFKMVPQPPTPMDFNGYIYKVKEEAEIEIEVKKEEDNFVQGRVPPPPPAATCSKPGCFVKFVWWRHRNGRCIKHGPKATCSSDGCDTNARSRGRCAKHGAYGKCSFLGCESNAIVRGLCKKHGANGICSATDCTSNAKSRGGRCHKHGANGSCSVVGCTTSAITRKRGLCSKHGAHGVCSAPGCKTNARARGVCSVHSALGKCWCGAKGVCTKHERQSVKREPLE